MIKENLELLDRAQNFRVKKRLKTNFMGDLLQKKKHKKELTLMKRLIKLFR